MPRMAGYLCLTSLAVLGGSGITGRESHRHAGRRGAKARVNMAVMTRWARWRASPASLADGLSKQAEGGLVAAYRAGDACDDGGGKYPAGCDQGVCQPLRSAGGSV